MKPLLYILIGITILCGVATAQNPGNVNGDKLWLRADQNTSTTTDGAKLNTWDDNSTQGNNATQATNALRPVFEDDATNDINFNPVISFSGTTFMNLGTTGLPNAKHARSVIIVAAPNSVSGTQYVFSYGQNVLDAGISAGANGSAGLFSGFLDDVTTPSGLWKAGAPLTLTSVWAGNGGTVDQYGNGVLEAGSLAKSYNSNLVEAAIGEAGWGGNNWNGRIAEVIVYNSALSAAQLEKIDSYLAIKYGYTLSGENYETSAGGTLWDLTSLATWSGNIAGVGRDDNEALTQLQSRSINSGFQLTVAIGNSIPTTNSANPGSFSKDKSYLMWGDNNAATGFSRNITVSGTTYTSMQRTWTFQQTNNWVDQNITISQDSGSTATYMLVASDAAFTNVIHVVSLSSGTTTLSTAQIPAGDFVTFAKIIPLPVNLISFTGLSTKEGNQLSWVTAGETHSAYFSIERSVDGRSYDSIGRVDGQGNTNLEYNYTFLDTRPVAGTTNYYRLRQVDDDGWFTYSPVVAINGGNSPTEYKAYPNPAHTTMHLAIPTIQEHLTLRIYALSGKIVQSEDVAQPGNGVDLDVSRLPAGMYYLRIVEAGTDIAFMKL